MDYLFVSLSLSLPLSLFLGETWGAPSPPHSLTVITHSATWMQFTWQPPEYSHPHERITYR